MLAAFPSGAGRQTIGTAAAVIAALVLSGCATDAIPAVAPDLIQASDSSNPERPPFFVQWKSGGMPGLTQRPAIAKETRLPEYPAAAVRNEDTGTTSLEACVTVEGRLVDVHVTRSSGSDVLDKATLDWAKTAKYVPAAFNGEPFAVCGYRFDYEWRVER